MPKFTEAELLVIRHAIRIGLEDGSLAEGDKKSAATAERIIKKIQDALSRE